MGINGKIIIMLSIDHSSKVVGEVSAVAGNTGELLANETDG